MRDGFTLIELLVVVALIALLIGVLLPALGGAKKSARTLLCQTNMRQMGTAAINYGIDYRDTIPAFSWKPGNYSTIYTDLLDPEDDLDSVPYQAVSIIRDFTGNPYIPKSTGGNHWFASLWFSHLVYYTYLTGNLEEPVAACPEDAEQVERAERAVQEYATNQVYRKFESSYEIAICSYTRDIPRSTMEAINQHQSHYRHFNRGKVFLKNRKFTQVQFTSGKAFMFDEMDRHFADKPGTLYFEDGTRQPILFFDGSVSVRLTSDANLGFQPLDPTSSGPTMIQVSSAPTPTHPGYFRWTRDGLRGIDFGGSEINTGQPNP